MSRRDFVTLLGGASESTKNPSVRAGIDEYQSEASVLLPTSAVEQAASSRTLGAIAVAADVADSAAVETMVARTEAELGPVTILVNNAGVAWQGTLDTYDREQVARMRQVNVDGVIHATRAVIGSMRAQRYGRIVNVASIAGIGTALSGNAFYAATKAEVLILTRRFALELGQHGITVNAVAPGFVRTELTQLGRGAADWPGTEQRFAQRAMMGRIGEPEDIANAVVFLAAPESGWITAQVLTVDGGRMDYIGHG